MVLTFWKSRAGTKLSSRPTHKCLPQLSGKAHSTTTTQTFPEGTCPPAKSESPSLTIALCLFCSTAVPFSLCGVCVSPHYRKPSIHAPLLSIVIFFFLPTPFSPRICADSLQRFVTTFYMQDYLFDVDVRNKGSHSDALLLQTIHLFSVVVLPQNATVSWTNDGLKNDRRQGLVCLLLLF